MANQSEGIQFERPIGSPADTSELEYTSALHQTELDKIRINGTVHAKDIRDYLTSRHGVYVEESELEKHIILELCGTYTKREGGGDDSDSDADDDDGEEPMMDLCQMVTLLIIPFLRQEDINEAAKGNNPLTHGLAEQVLKLILEEMETQGVDMAPYKAVDDNFETGTNVSVKLIRKMFDTYGEYHVPEDVLKEMVEMARPNGDGNGNNKGKKKKASDSDSDDDGSDDDDEDDDDDDEEQQKKQKSSKGVIMLNKDSFQRALTADVQLYDPKFETQPTTNIDDVHQSVKDSDAGSSNSITMDSKFYTAPNIDHGADHYKSYLWVIFLWMSFLLSYLCYMYEPNGFVNFDTCNNAFGCLVASDIVNWLIAMGQFGIRGFFYIYLGSLGNGGGKQNGARSALGCLLAMWMVAANTILPNFLEGANGYVFNTTKSKGWEALYWATFGVGIMLIMIQLIGFIDTLSGGKVVGGGGRIRTEQCIKEAATKKVNIMVDNAMLCHVTPMIQGDKPKKGGWRYPAKHATEIVIRYSTELHSNIRKRAYRDGTNIEALTGGDGSERALRHYKAMRDVTETVGGVIWAYERMADGRLYDEEGVWISARLMASNAVQWMVVGAVVVTYFVGLAWFQDQKANTVAVGQRQRQRRRLSLEEEEEVRQQQQLQGEDDALRQYIMEFERSLLQKQRQANHLRLHHHQHYYVHHRHHHPGQQQRYLQYVVPVNSTHYQIAGETGVYPLTIYDVNSTHFTDGTTVWPYSKNSHNGTHVFDKYFAYNSTGFTDGKEFYPYDTYATNGTHLTNGEYLFDGTSITAIPGNTAVNNVENWEFQLGLGVGLGAALVATFGIALVYMPSSVSTVLKFRSGFFRSLRGKESFQNLRESPHRVTTLLGGALWSSVYTACFCAFFAGGIAFLSAWSETRSTALRIYAILIGLVAAYLLNFAALRLFRELYLSFFYRRHPAATNFINVVLESWNLALSIGTMFIRAVKLLAVTVAYIGRIDVPTFSPGVGYVGPYALDSEHFDFKNDLLIHEAHRHPYMERLGMMYLMKLHHGSNFGSRAGAYWRMLFVLALMPWLRQYRVRHFGEEKPDRSENEEKEDDHVSLPTVADDSSLMSLHGMELEMDVVKRANDSLTQRNRDLKQSVEDLRSRLRAANKQVARLERRVERVKSKPKKRSPSTVEGVSKAEKPPPTRATTQEKPAQPSRVQAQTQPAAQARAQPKAQPNQVDDDETFESESEGKGGPASLKQSEEVSLEEFESESSEFEEDFQSDTDDETFSQVVAKEKAKLQEQRRQAALREKDGAVETTGNASIQSSFISEDDDGYESGKDNKQTVPTGKKSNQKGQNEDAESSEDEFEDEPANAEEELMHLLKKNKAKKAAEDRAAHRDPE